MGFAVLHLKEALFSCICGTGLLPGGDEGQHGDGREERAFQCPFECMFRCNPSKTSVNIIEHLKSYLGISFYTLSPISAIYFCSLISPKVTWTKAGFKAALWARRRV